MEIVDKLVDYTLAAVFLLLYLRSQTQLIQPIQNTSDQRREENREMRNLLFELARRGVEMRREPGERESSARIPVQAN